MPAEPGLLRDWLRSAVDAGVWGLSASERMVLRVLLDQPGRVMSRAELMARTGLGAAGRHLNVVDLSVSRLRAKLEGCGVQGQGIRTLRGQGYVWAMEP
jgi:DNA-binding response OmpR family regulator